MCHHYTTEAPKGHPLIKNGSFFFCKWEFVFRKWEFVLRKWEFVLRKWEFGFFENGSLFYENGSLYFEMVVKSSPGLAQASLLIMMADVQMSCNKVGSRYVFSF
jgi:hypothetical protein